MDFGRDHIHESGPTTLSNIRLLPLPTQNPIEGAGAEEEKNTDKPLSTPLSSLLIESANNATRLIFKTESTSLANSWLYPERICPRTPLITAGSLVVIFESFDNLTFAYVKPGDFFQNRNGNFSHNHFLEKPFGSQIRSLDKGGTGFVYLLRPTAELWMRSLNHRTQIVHDLDASMIVFQLHLKPGDVVLESGTGSGAMSHSLMRVLAPKGRLNTYEFNEARATSAREEFKNNQVDHLVTVHHKDVCEVGFGIGKRVADAAFLDLPEPWLAVPHAAYSLKNNGRIGSYSPCMEQTQRTVAIMRTCGFHTIRTMEVRFKEYYLHDLKLELPPTTTYEEVLDSLQGVDDQYSNRNEAQQTTEKEESEGDGSSNNDVDQINEVEPHSPKRIKLTCARPKSVMRGHTAFLTFATAGLRDQPDPLKNENNASE